MFVEQLHTIVKDALYAIEWDTEGTDCLSLFIDKMTDAQYLHSYFDRNIQKLSYYKQVRSVEEAVIATIEQIEDLAEELEALAISGKQYKSSQHLSIMFEPLENNIGVIDFGPTKAKGHRYHSPWLRLYAIKLDQNEYVLTGGGIKLVARMEEDPDLKIELDKLLFAEHYFSDDS